MIYDFEEKLLFSQGVRQMTEIETLRSLIDGCDTIKKANLNDDRAGIDYIVTLLGGATINIDHKAREKGCSRFWKNGEPEFAPETWSIMPGGKYKIPMARSKIGWTLDQSKKTDYIFCTFRPNDCEKVFLLPYQLYRIVFAKHLIVWRNQFKIAIQDSRRWESECIFIPAKIIIDEIQKEMEHQKSFKKQLELFDAEGTA